MRTFSSARPLPLAGSPCAPAVVPPADPDEQDRALVERVSARDRAAFETLYHRYAPRLARFVRRFLRQRDAVDEVAVDEVVDDTLLVVWDKARTFERERRVSSWIFGIARNKALQERSRWKRRPDLALNAAALDAEGLEEPEDFARRLAHRDELRGLVQALAALSLEQRTVVELTFFEGFSYSEIAEITGVSVNTVKVRMMRARRILKRRNHGPTGQEA